MSAMIQLLSNALSASIASKLIPSISGATPTVSKRCPGSSSIAIVVLTIILDRISQSISPQSTDRTGDKP